MKEWKISREDDRKEQEDRPKIFDDPQKAELLLRAKHRALYILERSDKTEQELRLKLAKNYEADIVEEALAYVKRYHYIDDKRYAVNYLNTRSRTKSRRQAKQELLYKRGVSREVLEEALLEAEPWDESRQIRLWMEKKHICPETATSEELRKFYLFLMRRGFRSEEVLREFHRSPDGEA